jgi:hypothetical protein
MPSVYSINSITKVYYAKCYGRERRTGGAVTRPGLERLRLRSSAYTSLKSIGELVCGASTKPSLICIDPVAWVDVDTKLAVTKNA